jgi:hypothetical protein
MHAKREPIESPEGTWTMKCYAHTAVRAPFSTVRCLVRLPLVLAITLSSLLTACFPYRYTERPGISGQTVSTGDVAPIPVATVRATFSHPFESHEPMELATLADGSFHFPAKTFWGVYFVAQHRGRPGTCRIEVTADGYEKEVREFEWWLASPSLQKLGTIELRKASGTSEALQERARTR